MPFNSIPQEIVDEIVDCLAYRRRVSWLDLEPRKPISNFLAVSSKFRNRARYHVFKKINIGQGYSPEKLKRRLELLAELVASSDSTHCLTAVATLVRSFTLTISQETAKDVFITTQTTLLDIMNSLSSANSNLRTLFLNCEFIVNHHCIFNRSFLAALHALAHAPHLVNLGTFNISLGDWAQGSQVETLLGLFGILGQDDWMDCMDKVAGREGGAGCLWQTRNAMLMCPKAGGNPSILPNLKIISIGTSQLNLRFTTVKEGTPFKMPALVDVKIDLDVPAGLLIIPHFLKESYESLKSLQIDFTGGLALYSEESDDRFTIAPFTNLSKLRLKHLALDSSDDSQAVHSTPTNFLTCVAGMLDDDPLTPCPLNHLTVELGWAYRADSWSDEPNLCISNHTLWKDVDAALIALNPTNPPRIDLSIGLGSNSDRFSVCMRRRDSLMEMTPLPMTKAIFGERFHFSSPASHSIAYARKMEPDTEMAEVLAAANQNYDVDEYWYYR